jgi:hypothetical protein
MTRRMIMGRYLEATPHCLAAEKLKALIDQAGYGGLGKIAAWLNMRPTALARVITGKRRPRSIEIDAIYRQYGIGADDWNAPTSTSLDKSA